MLLRQSVALRQSVCGLRMSDNSARLLLLHQRWAFAAIFAMLGLLRYRRRVFGVLVLWGVAPAFWVIYYLLVLDPQSRG